MVKGIKIFKEHFKDFQDSYIIIGGTACDIILEDAGFTPRATDDIDIILIVEALSPEFVKKFWEFITLGQYNIKQINQEKRNCYRFAEPQLEDYPKQLELFCREPDVITVGDGAHLTPIPVDEGLSSMSAILLDQFYYAYTLENSIVEDGIHIAEPQAIICLKAFAFLNNTQRKKEGQDVRAVDIKKHKYDVFRMLVMLQENDLFTLPDTIKEDLQNFVNTIKEDLPDNEIFARNAFPKQDMNALLNKLIKIFDLS
jgi:hypothetical protein